MILKKDNVIIRTENKREASELKIRGYIEVTEDELKQKHKKLTKKKTQKEEEGAK